MNQRASLQYSTTFVRISQAQDRLNHTGVLTAFAAVIATFVLSGCVSFEFRLLGNTAKHEATIMGLPAPLTSGRPMIQLRGENFLLCRAEAADTVFIERYDGQLRRTWSTAISPRFSSADFYPYPNQKWNGTELLNQMNVIGNHVALLRTRYGTVDPDSAYADITMFDLADGTVRSTRTLDSARLQDSTDPRHDIFTMQWSQDSTYTMVAIAEQRTTDSVRLKLTVMTSDFQPLSRRAITRSSNQPISALALDNAGDVIMLTDLKGGRLRIDRLALAGGKPDSVVTITMVDSAATDLEVLDYSFGFDGSHQLLFQTALGVKSQLTHVSFTRLSTISMTVTQSRTARIQRDTLRAILGESGGFHNASFESMYPYGNNPLAFVTTIGGTSDRYGKNKDVALILGQNHDGDALWMAGLRLTQIPKRRDMWRSHPARSGAMQILHRDRGLVEIREYNTVNGKENVERNIQLLNLGSGIEFRDEHVLWINDNTLVVAVPTTWRQSIWQLIRLDVGRGTPAER